MKRALLVEDNEADAEITTRDLARAGFAVTRACTLAAARYSVLDTRFDLVVLDLGLPDAVSTEDTMSALVGHATALVVYTGDESAKTKAAAREASVRLLVKGRDSLEAALDLSHLSDEDTAEIAAACAAERSRGR